MVIRYADDLVVGFEHRDEAERFLKEFGLRRLFVRWLPRPKVVRP